MRKETDYSIPWENIQADLFTPEEIEEAKSRVKGESMKQLNDKSYEIIENLFEISPWNIKKTDIMYIIDKFGYNGALEAYEIMKNGISISDMDILTLAQKEWVRLVFNCAN